jgi:hypothetical protein
MESPDRRVSEMDKTTHGKWQPGRTGTGAATATEIQLIKDVDALRTENERLRELVESQDALFAKAMLKVIPSTKVRLKVLTAYNHLVADQATALEREGE